jgi:SAM-dependent methyltransferase
VALVAVARLFRRRPPRLAPRDAYALWAESYPPAPHNAVMRAEQAVMAPMIAAARPGRALDVGTGTGRYLAVLAAAGAKTVVGADLSIDMLRRHEGRPARICADARRLPFRGGSFDCVVSSLMLGDIETPAAWIGEIARLLAPGGHLVYSDFHPSWRAEGWERTFQTRDGRCFRIPYHPHTIGAHLDALGAHGFHVITIREPRLQGADAPAPDDRRGRLPVIVAFHAVRNRTRVDARSRTP